jgi:outer membrane biosynthesis protein TonB
MMMRGHSTLLLLLLLALCSVALLSSRATCEGEENTIEQVSDGAEVESQAEEDASEEQSEEASEEEPVAEPEQVKEERKKEQKKDKKKEQKKDKKKEQKKDKKKDRKKKVNYKKYGKDVVTAYRLLKQSPPLLGQVCNCFPRERFARYSFV